MATNYKDILKAHAAAKKAVILWGSSGTGKTSILIDFAKENNLKLILRSMSTIIPTELSMLIYENGKIEEKYCDFIDEILNPVGEPILLFLDEITRPANDKSQAMLIPLISERMFNGKKIRDNIFIVGASNLSEEDHGVTELHDAVMRRCTHISHRVSFDEEVQVSSGFVHELKLAAGPIAAPQTQSEYIVPNLNCPRQRTDLALILEAGREFLSNTDIRTIAIGRLGLEHGSMYAQAAIDIFGKEKANPLPSVFTEEHFAIAKELQSSGNVIELSHYFEKQIKHDEPNIAAVKFICQESNPELFDNVLNLTEGFFLDKVKIDGAYAISHAGATGRLNSRLGIK